MNNKELNKPDQIVMTDNWAFREAIMTKHLKNEKI